MLHHAIAFTRRDEFESAWPHLLKVKSRGALFVLRRAPSFWLGDKATAGVCVHTPPVGEAPIADRKDAQGNWEKTIYIELIVDGEIIDLNRILLPADTPIIDERFAKNGSEIQALAVIVIAAIVIGRRHATPSPLTPQETQPKTGPPVLPALRGYWLMATFNAGAAGFANSKFVCFCHRPFCRLLRIR